MRLVELLANAEVKWIELEHLGTLTRGKRFVRSDIRPSGVPCIHYGELYTHYGISATQSKSFLDASLASSLRRAHHGDVIIVSAGETIEDIGNGTAWLGKRDVVIHDACFAYRSELNPAYVSHFLRTKLFKDQIRKHVSSGKISSINASGLGKARIPIPYPNQLPKSLAIQAEIVRILDAFTELTADLTAELTAELTARKKQYQHYRDQLLRFEDGEVEWKTLGEIGEFTYGYVAKAQDAGNVRFVRITDINPAGKLIATDSKYVDLSADNKRYLLKKGDLLMARTGATYGKTVIFEEEYPAIYAGFLIKLSLDNTIIIPKFYWHFAQSSFFWDQAKKLVSGGGQPQFNGNALREVRMPIPRPSDPVKSLAEQARVVAILDRFDALTNSLSEGLPREMELRQQQYTYYRDLLLSFPKPEDAAG